jgi:hypothetical protein
MRTGTHGMSESPNPWNCISFPPRLKNDVRSGFIASMSPGFVLSAIASRDWSSVSFTERVLELMAQYKNDWNKHIATYLLLVLLRTWYRK